MCRHFYLTCVEITCCCKLQQFCCPYTLLHLNGVNKWTSYECSDDVKLYSQYISQQIATLLYIKRACELNKSHIISTDEDPGLRIESFAVINLCGVSTNKTIIYFIAMQTYKELILNTFTIHLLVYIHH